MRQIRTDLALEAREFYCETGREEDPSGVVTETEEQEDVLITRVNITDSQGEKAIGKPKGRYVTLESAGLAKGDPACAEQIAKVFSKELKQLLPERLRCVLTAGLGNWNITPDALGPKVVSRLFVTRHLKQYFSEYSHLTEVCAISPGVLGITGMETGEIIKGIVEELHPDCVIAIDALASRKMSRVNATIQLSDTGISPGSGVGNHRFALNRESLGVPVIGIGIPTVVDAATIAGDAIALLVSALQEETGEAAKLATLLEDPYDALREVLHQENLIVTPKDTDFSVTEAAKVLASGLNIAFHPDFSYQELLQLQG